MNTLIAFSHKTLKELSYDEDNEVYVVDSRKEAIAFDDYTDEVCENGKSRCSVDALIINKDQCYCVEFKNIDLDKRFKKYKREVELKYYHTLTTLITNTLNFNEYKYTFLLVVPEYRNYSNRSRYFEKEINYISKLKNVDEVKIMIKKEFESLIEN